jgi:hypothetical protein
MYTNIINSLNTHNLLKRKTLSISRNHNIPDSKTPLTKLKDFPRRKALSASAAEVVTCTSDIKDKNFIIDNLGLKFDLYMDETQKNPHLLAASIRKAYETIFFKFVDTHKIFEIAASERTIKKKLENYHYNRPNIVYADKKKLNSCIENNVPHCTCTLEDRMCNHADDAEVIFSVDTIYYVMEAIVNDIYYKKRTHVHVFGIYSETETLIGNPERTETMGNYTLTPTDNGLFNLTAYVYGNNEHYKHTVPCSIQRPYYPIMIEGKQMYLNFYAMTSIAPLRGMLYGVFHCLLEENPRDELIHRLTKIKSPNLSYCELQKTTHTSTYTLDFLTDVPNGIYQHEVDGKIDYLMVNNYTQSVNFIHEGNIQTVVPISQVRELMKVIVQTLFLHHKRDDNKQLLSDLNQVIVMKLLGPGSLLNKDSARILLHITKHKLVDYVSVLHNWTDEDFIKCIKSNITTLHEKKDFYYYIKRYSPEIFYFIQCVVTFVGMNCISPYTGLALLPLSMTYAYNVMVRYKAEEYNMYENVTYKKLKDSRTVETMGRGHAKLMKPIVGSQCIADLKPLHGSSEISLDCDLTLTVRTEISDTKIKNKRIYKDGPRQYFSDGQYIPLQLTQEQTENIHQHKCVSCNIVYHHIHKYKNEAHAQFKYQCPNVDCDYHYSKVTRDYIKETHYKNIMILDETQLKDVEMKFNKIINNETHSLIATVSNVLAIPKFECTCKAIKAKKKHMIKLSNVEPFNEPIIYGPCLANNLAALFRMAQKQPVPEPIVFEQFTKYINSIIIPEAKVILDDFKTSKIQWYNHLIKTKQDEVKEYLNMDVNQLTQYYISKRDAIKTYSNFVKSEKQFIESDIPKTRCICAPIPLLKYIMGPVVLEMERRFKNNFKGYSVPPTWEEQEQMLDEWELNGFTYTLQLDGSSFDLTQHQKIKTLIDQAIYNIVYNQGGINTLQDNVTRGVFEESVNAIRRKIQCNVFEEGKINTHGVLTVYGKTFSGSPDTTLMNTIRMVCYNRFVNEGLLGLNKDEYKLWVKGDDVVCSYDSNLTRNRAMEQYANVFTQDKEIKIHGLGQIAKYYKLGDLTDIDFCSTNVIRTLNGHKIIRKILNLAQKQNYSVKATFYDECKLAAYNRDQIIASRKWAGDNDIIKKYMEKIHDYSIIKAGFYDMVIQKKVIPKERLEIPESEENYQYLDRIYDYETHLKMDERTSSKELNSLSLIEWMGSKQDNEEYENTKNAFDYIIMIGAKK